MISASTGSAPPTLNIRARSNNAKLAAEIADVVALDFMDYVIEQRLVEIARLQAAAAAQGIGSVSDLVAAQLTAIDGLELLEPATVPSRPLLPRTPQNVMLGGMLGLMLAIGAALLLNSLSDTVRDPEEVRRRFGVNTLGNIFKWSPQEVSDSELVLWKYPSSGFSEAFRQTRTNIQFATANQKGQILMVSSPGPGEGKSTIISNLAVALAQAGRRVLIVDGDLRRPSIHRRFPPTEREPGLSNFLSDALVPFDDVVHRTELEGISIIPGGPIPPNPSELLGSRRMSLLTEQLRKEADVVLVDTPPVLLVSDSAIIASQVDGVVMVVDSFATRNSALKAALSALENTQVNVVGIIINKLKRFRFGYGYSHPYYYYFNYGYYKYGYSENSDKDRTAANGRGPAYARPFTWVKSVLSRLPTSRDKPEEN